MDVAPATYAPYPPRLGAQWGEGRMAGTAGRVNGRGNGVCSLAPAMPHLSSIRRALFARVAAAAVLVAAVVAPAAGQGTPATNSDIEAPEVTRLTLKGVKHADPAELQQSIATVASHCRSLLLKPFCLVSKSHFFYQREFLDRTEFKRDVLRIKIFYWKRGYREAQVDTTVADAGRRRVTVTFHVHEGPPTRLEVVRVGPDSAPLTTHDRRRLVTLRAGEPLNVLSLDSSRTRLRNALWDRGYADATVDVDTSSNDTLHVARVAFLLHPRKPTTVGELRIKGNEDVSERTIRNSLSFRKGDLFRRSDVIRSQRSLYESNLFKRAAIDTVAREDTTADSVKAVVVTVTEAPPREARLSGGFNTIEFVQFDGRFTHYNWFGGARRLDLQGTIGNLLSSQLNGRGIFKDVMTNAGDDRARYFAPTWQASAAVQQRWFGSPDNTIGLNVFAHRRSSPGIFVDRGYGTSATFTREFAERAPVSANYRFEITRVEAGDVYFCVNYGVCDVGTIDALRGNQRLSPVSITGSWDRTNNPLGPSRGFVARATVEHASAFTVSDYRYNRAYGEGAYFFHVGKASVLATRVRLGWVRALASTQQAVGTEALHPRKRFYAGGASSVRGYGENQLGPRVLTIPAEKLRGKSGEYCPTTKPIEQCDPNESGVSTTGEPLPPVDNTAFTPRPVGGSSLAEASVEYRFPLPLFQGKLLGATFVDAGAVGSGGELAAIVGGHGAVTPGIGVRYASPIGHIRVDLGYHPRSVQQLTVVTEEDVPGEPRRLVVLQTCPAGAPLNSSECKPLTRTYVEGDRFLDRLTLHLSIGEAF